MARCSPTAYFPIIGFAIALRNAGVRQIGNLQQYLLQCGLNLFKLGFGLLQFVAKIGDFRQDSGNILTPAFGIADLLGGGITPRLQFLGAGLKIFAFSLPASRIP